MVAVAVAAKAVVAVARAAEVEAKAAVAVVVARAEALLLMGRVQLVTRRAGAEETTLQSRPPDRRHPSHSPLSLERR